jgi:hypothetical protein
VGLLGPSRERRGPDPHLDIKIFLFMAGAALAGAGMALERPILVWLAFIPLAAVALLRFFRPKS